MHQVREFHCVLNKEHRHVIADQIPIAFVGIELDRKAAHISRGVFGAALARYGGETHKHRRNLASFLERRSTGDLRHRFVSLKVTVGARTACVHDAFGNALVVKMRDFFAQDKVFEQSRAAQTGLQRILVIRNRHALISRQHLCAGIYTHPVERGDGRVNAVGSRAAGFIRSIVLAERAARGKARRRFYRLARGRVYSRFAPGFCQFVFVVHHRCRQGLLVRGALRGCVTI